MRVMLVIVAASVVMAGCGDDPPPAAPAGTQPAAAPAPAAAPPAAPASVPLTSDGLAAHFRAMVEAAKAQDVDAIKRLVVPMVPSRTELAGVVKPGAEGQAWLAAYDGPVSETFLPEEAPKAGLGSPTRTEIFVHRTTTEELAAYERGSTAFKEFPGGMKDFARAVAAPGRTWWCVEAREPGKDSGTRFTAFTDVGGRFILVVKPWRALRKAGAEAGEGEGSK
jgi:hypothetical protein